MLLKIFISFFKIGLFTFGGGYAMLPMIEAEVVKKQKWITEDKLLEITGIAQITPGVIAINTAVYAGKVTRGILGAFFACVGVILPSFLIIIGIFLMFSNNFSNIYVQKAFLGVRCAIVALILKTVINLYKKRVKDYLRFFYFLISFILLAIFKVNPILIIITAVISIFIIFHLSPIKPEYILEAD